ncbi:monovalent cation/H(+) antiporter subunit G [Jannaschia sp. R86511]|uniref:monovalent cation/H(+) antiporter subunit G n=1 Tax=Jannaschia sp. R86511 TaxID=3093853 RepID=UPI0036D31620
MSAAELVQAGLGYALVGLGVALLAVAGLGLLRFPDAYSRLSAVTKAATLGLCLTLLGVLVLDPSWTNAVKVLLAVALQFVTSPVGGFALGRAAYRSGSPLAPSSSYDELADHLGRRSDDVGSDDVSGDDAPRR